MTVGEKIQFYRKKIGLSQEELGNASRRERIAKGSGTQLADVNRLIKQFDQTRKMMKTVAGGNMQQRMMQQMRHGGKRRR